MIATNPQHYHQPDRTKDVLFDAEWDTLSRLSRTSQMSERAILCDGFWESNEGIGMAETEKPTDWVDEVSSLGGGKDRLDLVLLDSSSLTEGSFYSLHSESESTLPFDEEEADSKNGRSVVDEDHTSQQNTPPNDQPNRTNIEATTNTNASIGMSRSVDDHSPEFPRGGSISYAQLFFDPETKALVTLMEISNDLRPASRRTNRSATNGKAARGHSRLEKRKQYVKRGTPLHQSSVVVSSTSPKNENGDKHSVAASRESEPASHSTDVWNEDEDRPYQDETLSTECSSLSTATCRKHDRSQDSESDDDDRHWGFPVAPFHHPPAPTRFSDEPIVFSNDRSMDQKLCWLDQADVGLYLLHDCDDPWDYGGSPRGAGTARCGESLLKLLTASRLCISLVQLGDLKWRASSTYHRTADLPQGNHKAKVERMSYSVLNDM